MVANRAARQAAHQQAESQSPFTSHNVRRPRTSAHRLRRRGSAAPRSSLPEVTILDSGNSLTPTDWSRDDQQIVFSSTTSAAAGFRIWSWFIDGRSPPQVVVDTSQNAMHGHLSPDGRWLAYASDESGLLQVYVQPHPNNGERRQISRDGGGEPRWRGDGQEPFYLATDGKLMSISVPGGNAFDPRAPQALFDARVPLAGSPYRMNYTVTSDGKRFLVNTRVEDTVSPINVVLNWTAILKK